MVARCTRRSMAAKVMADSGKITRNLTTVDDPHPVAAQVNTNQAARSRAAKVDRDRAKLGRKSAGYLS